MAKMTAAQKELAAEERRVNIALAAQEEREQQKRLLAAVDRMKVLTSTVDEHWEEHENDSPAEWLDSMIEVVVTWAAATVPDSLRPVTHNVLHLARAICLHIEGNSIEYADQWPNPALVGIADDVCKAVAKVNEDTPSLAPLESILELHDQRVPRQIARIYGFIDENGNPDIWKVNEEIAESGKHVNESWRDPRIAEVAQGQERANNDPLALKELYELARDIRRHRQPLPECEAATE